MFKAGTKFSNKPRSGDECAIILRDGKEICVTADEGWDVEAQSQAHHDAYILSLERGYL